MTLDPVDYAVISNAILAAAREAGVKLVKSAYSTIVREAKDASAGLLDRHGNIIAQAEMNPMQLGSMGATLRPCLEAHPIDTIEEGDFLINNHPFMGGQHLQDVFIFTPIFVDGRIIGFGGSVAHHLDLGGGSAGLNNAATDVYQEGLLIPPSKYNRRRDWDGGPFERLIAANVRVPDQTLGDFNAQFAANAIAVERIKQLCAKYGRDSVEQVMEGLLDYTERQLRSSIAAIPDGVYHGEDAVDDDGINDEPLWVRAKVTVTGDQMEVDLEGTCPQVGRNLNSPLASTVSAVMSCVKGALLTADVPFNDGGVRPVKLKVPHGSLLNPKSPAPVRARMEACYRAYDAVMRALAQAIPERAIASGLDATFGSCFTNLRDGRYRVCIEVQGGGFGASSSGDGADGTAAPLGNTGNQPIEALDMEFDFFRVVGYGLEADTCGHGRQRGGLGIWRKYEVLADGVAFSLYADRFKIAPQGLFGGRPGSLSRCEIYRDGVLMPASPTKNVVPLKRGDVVLIVTSGGAGFGEAQQRPEELIRRDVEQGFISARAARESYGYGAGTSYPAQKAASA